jgi:RNA polymerase sigma-70 factor (ECF subfamily)
MTMISGADRGLVEGLQRRDPEAAERLVEQHAAWIHRVVHRVLRDVSDVEEVTQDVLLTATRKIDQFDGRAALSTWLYRIAINGACNRLRRRRARPEVTLEPWLPDFDSGGQRAKAVEGWTREDDDPAIAAEVRLALERSIGRLPDEYRAVIVLRDVEQLPNEAIAATLKLSVPAVKSRVHRARLILRKQLTHLFSPGEGRCLQPAVSAP